MVLEISPVESFNQIKEINRMLQRTRKITKKKKEEPKAEFNPEDEVELRAFILQHTSTTKLTQIKKLVEMSRAKGFNEEDIVNTVYNMLSEKLLDSLDNRYLLRLDDSD